MSKYSVSVEAAAKAWFYCQHSIMHDHEENWRAFQHKDLYRECALMALAASALQSAKAKGE